jgi:hypothetical protein
VEDIEPINVKTEYKSGLFFMPTINEEANTIWTFEAMNEFSL